jgi:radical SAM protein with 4Fe4S-binding SPASM domain
MSASLGLVVTTRCPNRCTYCYVPDSAGEPREMPLDVLGRALDSLEAKRGRRALYVIGGEPLLVPELTFRALRAARTVMPDARLSLTTGGVSRATAADVHARELRDLGVRVTLSLDGPSHVHDEQRRTKAGRGTHEGAVKTLRALQCHAARVSMRATLDPAIWGSRLPVREALAEAERLRVPYVAVELAANRRPADGEAFDPRPAVREAVDWYVARKGKSGRPAWHELARVEAAIGAPRQLSEIRPRCGACRTNVAVGPDGSLYPCHRMPVKIGDVWSGVDRARAEDWWAGTLGHRAVCMKTCADWTVCRGGCPGEDGPRRPSPVACLYRRALVRGAREALLRLTASAGVR